MEKSMQRIIVRDASKAETEVNELLEKGWKVISVTAQNVSIALASSDRYQSTWNKEIHGKIIFVLEKQDPNLS